MCTRSLPNIYTLSPQACGPRDLGVYIRQATCVHGITIKYCTLHGWIKGTKCALFSIKCKGAVWETKHSYEVNLLLFLFYSALQNTTVVFLHTSITLDSWL